MKLLAKHDPQPSFPILKITFHLLNTIPGSACNILIALLLEKKEMNASALAFFQFANQDDQDLFDPALTPSPFRHIALKVDADGQAELERRLTAANWKPEGTYVLEHGYCRSLYTEDPNGMLLEFTVDVDNADEIASDRVQDAHATLERWLAGDHTSNNNYR